MLTTCTKLTIISIAVNVFSDVGRQVIEDYKEKEWTLIDPLRHTYAILKKITVNMINPDTLKFISQVRRDPGSNVFFKTIDLELLNE